MTTYSRLALAALLAATAAGCAVQQGSVSGMPEAPTVSEESTVGVPPRQRDIVVHALSLIGTPYRYGGSRPETGFDCSGLVRYVTRVASGLTLPADAKGISEVATPVAASDMQPGDLVFFNTLRKPYSHVGIYLGGQRFIHAPSAGGVVEIVNLKQRYWQQRYEGARRLPL